MSLTNPVLNDIITKEINMLKSVILNLEVKMENYINDSKKHMDDLGDKIIKQDAKIDVIHKLFNSYKNIISAKTNDDEKITNSECEHFKKRIEELEKNIGNQTSFLVNLMNEKIKSQDEQIVELRNKVNNRTGNVNIPEENKLVLLENINNQILEQIVTIKNQYNNFSKNVGDNNYRLNGLENKYRNIDRRVHNLSNSYDERPYNYEQNYEIDREEESGSPVNDQGPNWIKVTKKKTNRRYNRF